MEPHAGQVRVRRWRCRARKTGDGDEVNSLGPIEDGATAVDQSGSWPSPVALETPSRQLVVTRQQSLPLPWQLIRPSDEVSGRDFAHPAERDFARILTFYRIRWAYEPTSFSLSIGEDGRPSEMFTPDFYLPDHRLYIELTTMRQRLVTKKNRKLRRLRELYPTVRIKLLYRRDYDRLVTAYRIDEPADSVSEVGSVLYSEEDLLSRIEGLADQIAEGERNPHIVDAKLHHGLLSFSGIVPLLKASRDRLTPIPPDDRLVMLAVDQGSAIFADHLAYALRNRDVSLELDLVQLTRHESKDGDRRVRIGRAPRIDVNGRRVLLAADVVSTGLSLAYLTSWLLQRGAREVEICALLDRRSARLIDVPVRYVGFEAPNELLVGFGLQLRRQFKGLPYIASVVSRITAVAPSPEPLLSVIRDTIADHEWSDEDRDEAESDGASGNGFGSAIRGV
jgi:hypoxanthine phosphoribosyltransferase